ncbi:hypothetical protein [Tenacibaculum maritimum]|uniref:hypothetical protein n=1 Tax=Tenacibaculum maritimum TaxID=107401 RepID=UPI00387770D2
MGVQGTYAKTELVLPQKEVSFSIQQNQIFKSLEKEPQPNIGFLKEKSKFVISEGVSAQNHCNYTEWNSYKLVNKGDGLIKRLDELNLSVLTKKLDDLGDATKAKFFDDFAEASDDVLRNLDSDDELISLWNKYADDFKGNKYVTDEGVFKTCQSVLDKHPDGYLGNLVKKVMEARKPTNSEQVLVGVTHPSFGNKVFMRSNFKNSERVLENSFKTETAHPLIRERIKYMDFVRNSVTEGMVVNETLARKLLDIDSLKKLTTSGRAGYHGEVRALSDALYELEKTRSVTKSTLSEFDLFIRNSSNKVMQRCPCCFHITQGVKVLEGK